MQKRFLWGEIFRPDSLGRGKGPFEKKRSEWKGGLRVYKQGLARGFLLKKKGGKNRAGGTVYAENFRAYRNQWTTSVLVKKNAQAGQVILTGTKNKGDQLEFIKCCRGGVLPTEGEDGRRNSHGIKKRKRRKKEGAPLTTD